MNFQILLARFGQIRQPLSLIRKCIFFIYRKVVDKGYHCDPIGTWPKTKRSRCRFLSASHEIANPVSRTCCASRYVHKLKQNPLAISGKIVISFCSGRRPHCLDCESSFGQGKWQHYKEMAGSFRFRRADTHWLMPVALKPRTGT